MSFILDALKKSESERQRQSGPALFEVKVAPPRRRLPLWAIALGALLLVNLLVVTWVLLRKSEEPEAQVVAAPAPAPPVSAPITSAPSVMAPTAQSTSPPTASAGEQTSLSPPLPEDDASSSEQAPDEEPVAPLNPEDYEPAVEAAAVAAAVRSQQNRASSGAARTTGLPTLEEARAASGIDIPDLRIDFHIFADKAQDRLVFINSRKLRQGESLPNGARVDDITPKGAVISYRGARFILTP